MRRSCYTYYRSCRTYVFSMYNMNQAIWFSTQFCVANLMQSFPCPNSFSIISIHAKLTKYKVYMLHVPKSPAKMPKSQIWTLITLFWLGSFEPKLTRTSIIYICVYISLPKFAPFWTVKKKIVYNSDLRSQMISLQSGSGLCVVIHITYQPLT